MGEKENTKQRDSITSLEKEKLVLEKEKEDELSTYKIEIEKERNELDERLDEKIEQLKEMTKNYTEVRENCKRTEAELDQLKAAHPTETNGEDEEVNILHNRCSELEL